MMVWQAMVVGFVASFVLVSAMVVVADNPQGKRASSTNSAASHGLLEAGEAR